MASAEQIKGLIKSFADGDEERFFAVAMQVAAHAARHGHNRLAIELRDLIEEARVRAKTASTQRARVISIAKPRGELAGLLVATSPKVRLSDLAIEVGIQQRLRRIITEQRHRTRLREHALEPIRRVLLVGPPGTGKTMTASALAGELSLPLLTIQLHGLITKFMGETAAKLRLVFDAIAEARGVYFFDEFDALGGERQARNDVGEIRRVLNSFLQFLEQEDSDSLVLCATNHPQLLDKALFRRFDSVIEYALPSEELIRRIISTKLGAFDASHVRVDELVGLAKGLSHADVARACEQTAKNAVLRGTREIAHEDVVAALQDRQS